MYTWVEDQLNLFGLLGVALHILQKKIVLQKYQVTNVCFEYMVK